MIQKLKLVSLVTKSGIILKIILKIKIKWKLAQWLKNLKYIELSRRFNIFCIPRKMKFDKDIDRVK